MPLEIKGYEQFIPPSPFSQLDIEGFARKVTIENKFDLYDSSGTRRYELAILPLSNKHKLCIASLSAQVGQISWGRLMTIGEERSCDSAIVRQFIQVPVIPDQPDSNLTLADIMRIETSRNQWEKFTSGSFAGSRLDIIAELAAMGAVTLHRNLPETVDFDSTFAGFVKNINGENFAPSQIIPSN